MRPAVTPCSSAPGSLREGLGSEQYVIAGRAWAAAKLDADLIL